MLGDVTDDVGDILAQQLVQCEIPHIVPAALVLVERHLVPVGVIRYIPRTVLILRDRPDLVLLGSRRGRGSIRRNRREIKNPVDDRISRLRLIAVGTEVRESWLGIAGSIFTQSLLISLSPAGRILVEFHLLFGLRGWLSV